MKEYFKFWGQCLEWAYWRWGVGQRVLTIVSYMSTLVGVGIGWAFANKSGEYWFVVAGFAPLVFLTIFVAPYKLWKQKVNKLAELTVKRLRIELEKEPEATEKHIWWHLIIHNDSNIPIENCYGQLLSFQPNKSNHPYQAISLPWSSLSGVWTQTITIPSKSCKYLDFVMTNRKDLYIVTLNPSPSLRGTPFPEPPGKYEAEIQVGSEKMEFAPTKIRLQMILDNSGNLTVKEIRN